MTEIKGFVRWPTEADTWAEREVPDDYRLAIVDDSLHGGLRWAIEDRTPARPCRFTVGPGHALCRRPSVAVLDRGSYTRRRNHWGYCEQHLYGRHIEGDRVLVAILVPTP